LLWELVWRVICARFSGRAVSDIVVNGLSGFFQCTSASRTIVRKTRVEFFGFDALSAEVFYGAKFLLGSTFLFVSEIFFVSAIFFVRTAFFVSAIFFVCKCA
jgi:hypothetical protein